MPSKVSERNFRFDRVFGGRYEFLEGKRKLVGGIHITRTSGTNKKREFEYRNGLLTKLWERGQKDVLQAFAKGTLDIQDIVTADRKGKLGGLVDDMITLKPLWSTWEAAIPDLNTDRGRPTSEATRTRYKGAMKLLRDLHLPHLGDDAAIADLAKVNWSSVYADWDLSPAAWNHMRRALSRFLTVVLGDKFHQLRRIVMRNFPEMDEHPRVPEITTSQLTRIIAMVPSRYRSPFVVLALTGLRLGELYALTPDDIDEDTHSIRIRKGKTKASAATVYVPEEQWEHVVASVPPPVGHWYLRDVWRSAVDRAFPKGKKDIRIHDLRHFHAQRLDDEGVSEAAIQAQLRHTNPQQSRMYSMQGTRREVAAVMGRVLSNLAPANVRRFDFADEHAAQVQQPGTNVVAG